MVPCYCFTFANIEKVLLNHDNWNGTEAVVTVTGINDTVNSVGRTLYGVAISLPVLFSFLTF